MAGVNRLVTRGSFPLGSVTSSVHSVRRDSTRRRVAADSASKTSLTRSPLSQLVGETGTSVLVRMI